MPDTQISEALGLIDGGLQLLLAAVHADDPKREMLVRVGDLLRDVRSLEAALSGHVVVPRDDLVELTRICNGAEHDAKSVARKLVGHYMQHNVEVLAHTFKLIREKIKGHLPAPPVPEIVA